MTDQIPADKVREVRDLHRDAANMVTITDAEREIHQHVADAMDALLPAPPRPTLADMTWVERAECQWMQCDVKKSRKRHVIVNACDCHGKVELVSEEGEFRWEYPNRVTPRPDLPRLEWPGGKKPDTSAPESTLAVGSEWDNVDALTRECDESGRDQIVITDKDGDVFVWGVDAEWWEPWLPGCDYAPFTILHTGRNADQ